MKKIIFSLLLVMSLVALCACGSSKKYSSVEDFVNSDELQSEIAKAIESIEGMGIDLAVSAEGDKFVYTYTYEEIENFDGMADALEQGLNAEKKTFIDLANEIKGEVKVENPIVVVRYVDANGELVYEGEFAAE